MREVIVGLLEKYEDRIMEYTLGNSDSEWGGRFSEIYKYEWDSRKWEIAYTINKLITYGVDINSIEFAYLIISEWSGVMTFDDGDLDIEGLIGVCKDILTDLYYQ